MPVRFIAVCPAGHLCEFPWKEWIGCTCPGDGSLNLVRVATIEQAGPGDLTFLANMKYARALDRTRASAVIAGPERALREEADRRGRAGDGGLPLSRGGAATAQSGRRSPSTARATASATSMPSTAADMMPPE